MMKHTKRLPVIATCALIATLCGGCTLSGVRGDEEVGSLREHNKATKQASSPFARAIQSLGGIYSQDSELSQYVQQVANRVTTSSNLPTVKTSIVNNSSLNIWAISSGEVAVHRGLLSALESEAELATLIAHQLAHTADPSHLETSWGADPGTLISKLDGVVASPADTRPELMGNAILDFRFTGEAEKGADARTEVYLRNAGYDLKTAETLETRICQAPALGQAHWIKGLGCHHPAIKTESAQLESARGKIAKQIYSEKTAKLRSQQELYAQLDAAQDALFDGELEDARLLAEDGCARLPAEPRFHWVLGKVEQKQERWEEALSAFNRAVALAPNNYLYALSRAETSKQLGHRDAAYADLKKSTQLLPTAEAYNELASLYLEDGDDAQYEACLEKVAEASDSTLALVAERTLLDRNLRKDPNRFVGLQVFLDRQGYLNIAAVNNSIGTLNDIAVAVEIKDPENMYKASTVLKFEDLVEPGRKTSAMYTGIGPFKDNEHLKRSLVAHVIDGKIAEDGQQS